MDILICELAPDLLKDYLHFFDHVAFTDHSDWANCYCIHFHWQSEWDDESPKENRDRISESIENGKKQGYLAYSEGNVIGWCNANDKRNFAALKDNVKPEIWEDDDERKVKSVVCFTIAPDKRGKGIATALLDRVCVDAKEQGYEYIEVYPTSGSKDMYVNHHGPDSLYYKQGFILHKEFERQSVLRKYL
jgi:GNAT superfamily N-acetyltransferase